MDQNVGCMIAHRITSALLGLGLDYNTVSHVVYGECLTLAKEAQKGDWIELPDGTTYTLTFKP